MRHRPERDRALLETFATPASSDPVQPVEPLTGREEQILLTVARGRTNGEIAMWAFETGRVRR